MAQNGNRQALHDLFVKNRRLVYKYARHYEKIYNHSLSFEDLVNEGMLGMLTALEKFDLSKGTQFTTYATPWIYQKISRAIYDTGFNIRMPVHIFELISKVSKLDSEFTSLEENFSARVEFIAEKLNISTDKVREMFSHQYRYLNLTSLDAPVDEDSDSRLGNFLEDYDAPSLFEIVANKILNERLMEIFSTLTEKEKQVLIRRFGFYDGSEWTLEDIGRDFGLTRERIRQIEKKALEKISRFHELREWLY